MIAMMTTKIIRMMKMITMKMTTTIVRTVQNLNKYHKSNISDLEISNNYYISILSVNPQKLYKMIGSRGSKSVSGRVSGDFVPFLNFYSHVHMWIFFAVRDKPMYIRSLSVSRNC